MLRAGCPPHVHRMRDEIDTSFRAVPDCTVGSEEGCAGSGLPGRGCVWGGEIRGVSGKLAASICVCASVLRQVTHELLY